ncbi:MAG: glycosyltransferase [Sphingomonas sp.]
MARPDLGMAIGDDAPLGFAYGWAELVERARGADPEFTLGGHEHRLALESSGIEIDRRRYLHAPDIRGRIERVRDGVLSGWAVDAEHPDTPTPIEVLLDGTRYASATANVDREDLASKDIARRGGGFRFAVPPATPGDRETIELGIRAALTGAPIGDSPAVIEGRRRRRREWTTLLHTLPEPDAPAIAVIVPIYNAADDLAECLAALARNTTRPARLLLIDDASGNSAIDALLAEWRGQPNVEVHVNEHNLGFTGAVNRGMALAGRDDVVLLNSDTMVSPGWLEGLRAAAYSGADVATATPVSNNAGAFSVPEIGVANRLPTWFDVDDQARLVRQASLSLWPTLPTGNGFCLYIRRDCLDAIGPFDEAAFPRGYGEENDFCMRAWRAGMVHVVDDRSFVFHRRGASFGGEREANYAAAARWSTRAIPNTASSPRCSAPIRTCWRCAGAFAARWPRPSAAAPRRARACCSWSRCSPAARRRPTPI